MESRRRADTPLLYPHVQPWANGIYTQAILADITPPLAPYLRSHRRVALGVSTMNEATTEWLTAAQCAARTGLTVRALRVYENYGLITPGRSAAGWRRYGAQELLTLNEIGLLKVLGLTLNQIRDLTRRPSSSMLRQLVELQLDTWKYRLAEAERGRTVTEVALIQLQEGRSLSVEELCSLIRSFEMTAPAAATHMSDADEEVPPYA